MNEKGPVSLYGDIARAEKNIIDKSVGFIRDYLPFVILGLNILLSTVLKLFEGEFRNPFTPDFFISLTVNILTTMFCYICFVPYGETYEKKVMANFCANLEHWSVLSSKVRCGRSEEFGKYCKERINAEREERRYSIISNQTMIPYEIFEKEYRGKSPREIKKIRKSGVITRKEEEAINKANSDIRVKPINPVIILCGVAGASYNDAGRDGIKHSTVAILSRPVLMFVFSAVTTMLGGHFNGVTDWSQIYDMVFSALMIVFASVTGFTAGVTSARKEHDKIKGRIFFIEGFLENKTVDKNEGVC